MKIMGRNIEIVSCAIREQRIGRHSNILKNYLVTAMCPSPSGGSQDYLHNTLKSLKPRKVPAIFFFLCHKTDGKPAVTPSYETSRSHHRQSLRFAVRAAVARLAGRRPVSVRLAPLGPRQSCRACQHASVSRVRCRVCRGFVACN